MKQILVVVALATACGDNTRPVPGGDGPPTNVGLERVSQISAGTFHVCAISVDRTLWCWGDATVSRPIGIAGDFNMVAGGFHASCMLRQDGTLWCTGPQQFDGTYTAVAVGGTTCAIASDQTLWCWDWSTQQAEQLPGAGWIRISVGELGLDNDTLGCGIQSDGSLWCWMGAVSPVPFQIPGTTWSRVAVGAGYVCATQTDGSLWCWGSNNDSGQLGLGTTTAVSDPTQLAGNDWVDVAAGDYHTCGLRSDHSIWCWGQNQNGELGDGSTIDSSSPTRVAQDDWRSVTVGRNDTCAIAGDGSPWCWGTDREGEMGDGIDAGIGMDGGRRTPGPVPGTSWTTTASGALHSCALRTDGTLWCWGQNDRGQLGVATPSRVASPIQVPGTGWATVAASGLDAGEYTCATRTDGSLWCWGANQSGQLGDNTTVDHATPTAVPGSGWRAVSTGYAHACALKTDGTLWCWGDNTNGELGAAPGADGLAQVTGNDWASVAAGYQDTCAVKTDATLWCWGSNYYGQLGLGDTTPASVATPTRILGTTWQNVAAGAGITCATEANHTIWCWGLNDLSVAPGQRALAPYPVPGSDYASVTIGSNVCSMKLDGTLWCWNAGTSGGAGISVGPTPTQVAGSGWTSVGTGYSHDCATRADHSLWCWGSNFDGQLGDGSAWHALPMRIGGL